MNVQLNDTVNKLQYKYLEGIKIKDLKKAKREIKCKQIN